MKSFNQHISSLDEGKGPKQDKYHAGVSKSTKAKRVAQFKKQSKMDSDDPDAYKPAPGDKTAKTKESKHTKKARAMGLTDSVAEAKVPEHGLTKLGKNKGSVKRLVKKHLGPEAAEKITSADGAAIMKIAKEKGDDKLFKRGSFIKNFYEHHLDQLVENKSLRKKAAKSGVPYSILKDVFDRGKAAWRTGHRPGTNPEQWGHARVNSFLTGGKTRRTADKDLWKKAQAAKKKKKAKSEETLVEAEYQGRKVKLDDPIRNPSGSKKKFKVYVTSPSTGNVVKVEFGDPNMSIKRDSDDRRKAFRSRHGCDALTYDDDRDTPKYWSCRMWEKDTPVSELD